MYSCYLTKANVKGVLRFKTHLGVPSFLASISIYFTVRLWVQSEVHHSLATFPKSPDIFWVKKVKKTNIFKPQENKWNFFGGGGGGVTFNLCSQFDLQKMYKKDKIWTLIIPLNYCPFLNPLVGKGQNWWDVISIGTSLIWEKVTWVGCSWHLSFICCNLIDSLIWRLDEGTEKTQHPQSLPIYLPLTTVKKSHVSDLLNRNPVNLCLSFNDCRQCLPLAIEISQWDFLVLSKTN